MKIPSTPNYINSSLSQKITKNQKKQNVSFGAIYVESGVDLGRTAQSKFISQFSKRDELLLNEIAQLYPNQDCFIRKGYGNYPRLEFREKPTAVQVFKTTSGDRFRTEMNPADEEYPCDELILSRDDKVSNRIIGLQNNVATNPSLAFTITAGFEIHKKLMEKKQEIMEYVGHGDEFNLGRKSIHQRAYESIKDIEIAVKRYLLESAFAAFKDKASASQLYASNLPKIETRLNEKRAMDLTTSIADRKAVVDDELLSGRIDICKIAMKTYPNKDENLKRIKDLEELMVKNNYFFS